MSVLAGGLLWLVWLMNRHEKECLRERKRMRKDSRETKA